MYGGQVDMQRKRVCGIVEELEFEFGIELGLEEGDRSDGVSQLLDQLLQSVCIANPPQLEDI